MVWLQHQPSLRTGFMVHAVRELRGQAQDGKQGGGAGARVQAAAPRTCPTCLQRPHCGHCSIGHIIGQRLVLAVLEDLLGLLVHALEHVCGWLDG